MVALPLFYFTYPIREIVSALTKGGALYQLIDRLSTLKDEGIPVSLDTGGE